MRMKDILNDFENTWSHFSVPGIDTVMECPHCHKKMGFEDRFIRPLCPHTITCPYCGNTVTVQVVRESEKKGDG